VFIGSIGLRARASYLMTRAATGWILAICAVWSCLLGPLTRRSEATISSSTADTMIARNILSMPGQAGMARFCSGSSAIEWPVDELLRRGRDAAELSQFGNNVVRIHQYPPAADPFSAAPLPE
jgi:hypothetical protein